MAGSVQPIFAGLTTKLIEGLGERSIEHVGWALPTTPCMLRIVHCNNIPATDKRNPACLRSQQPSFT